MSNGPMLSLTGVSKQYGSHRALDGVDLELQPGHTLGLLGPNGAGKTTVLRLLLGLIRPTQGEVRLQGRDPQAAAAHEGIGFLPERLRLPPYLSIAGFLRLHGRLAGLDGVDLEHEIEAACELVGVIDRMADKLGSLSKGLNQRVGFAQAFIGQPRLLFLDEPTSGLDPIGMRQARDWISGARDRGCSILVSSHQLLEVERVCDSVAVLDRGKLLAQGSIDSVVAPGEALEDAFVRLIEAQKGSPHGD
jgi:ABC-2 type transport system ATP-binding protein